MSQVPAEIQGQRAIDMHTDRAGNGAGDGATVCVGDADLVCECGDRVGDLTVDRVRRGGGESTQFPQAKLEIAATVPPPALTLSLWNGPENPAGDSNLTSTAPGNLPPARRCAFRSELLKTEWLTP